MAAWRARCSYLVEAVRLLLPVVIQRDSADLLTVNLAKDGATSHLTALCGVAAMLYLSALARGIVVVVGWCRGVVEVVAIVVVDTNKCDRAPRTRSTKTATSTP
jgi:hypothetical protein